MFLHVGNDNKKQQENKMESTILANHAFPPRDNVEIKRKRQCGNGTRIWSQIRNVLKFLRYFFDLAFEEGADGRRSDGKAGKPCGGFPDCAL
jgi:hypothetical protein